MSETTTQVGMDDAAAQAAAASRPGASLQPSAFDDADRRADSGGFTVEDVEEAMRDVVDPELGINVVDLGLVYGITLTPTDEGDGQVAAIDMTLTSAACPLTDVIEDQTREALVGGPDPVVEDFRINWVWMPPWGPDKITEDGREQLRALGFNV
jgi:metal-sulfur cluster biosynthetic enzyme